LGRSSIITPFWTATNGWALPPPTRFSLVNGFDRDLTRKAVCEFMLKTMADGKLRFGLLDKWMAEHLVPLAR